VQAHFGGEGELANDNAGDDAEEENEIFF